ncbi:hypothetical protein [Roseateles cavernae]|uniref:hypothetical protein n=1 Tax=Roseateles cavernae TaxID=3153578 RepID=UPI0032E40A78
MSGEYLIQRTDGNWFDLDRKDYERTLVPKSLPWRAVADGYGDFCIDVSGCEISFSYEDPGIQVVFEDDVFSAEQELQLLTEMLENLTLVTGQQGKVISV